MHRHHTRNGTYLVDLARRRVSFIDCTNCFNRYRILNYCSLSQGHSNLGTMMTGSPIASNASIPLFSSGASTPVPPGATNRKRSDGSSEMFHSSISSLTSNDEAYFVPQWGPHYYAAVPQKRNQGTTSSKKRPEKGDFPMYKDGRVGGIDMCNSFHYSFF